MKNAIIAILVIILFLAGAYIYFLRMETPQEQPVPEIMPVSPIAPEEVIDEQPVPESIGGEKDDNGCLVAAGYSWCEEKNKCLRTWEEECEKTIKGKITTAMAEKYNKDESEVTITITMEEEGFVRGGVEFAPGGQGNAGMFLAAEVNGEWQIVYDGHGVPDCQMLKNTYQFPESMLEGICD